MYVYYADTLPRLESTYKELKPPFIGLIFPFSSSLESTYKELKQVRSPKVPGRRNSLESTYKELKLDIVEGI